DGIRAFQVTGVQTCALPILSLGVTHAPSPQAEQISTNGVPSRAALSRVLICETAPVDTATGPLSLIEGESIVTPPESMVILPPGPWITTLSLPVRVRFRVWIRALSPASNSTLPCTFWV